MARWSTGGVRLSLSRTYLPGCVLRTRRRHRPRRRHRVPGPMRNVPQEVLAAALTAGGRLGVADAAQERGGEEREGDERHGDRGHAAAVLHCRNPGVRSPELRGPHAAILPRSPNPLVLLQRPPAHVAPSLVDSRTDSPNNPAVLLQSGSETLSSSLQRRRPLSRHKQGDRELEISCCTAPCHPGTRDGRGELPRPGLWGPNDEGVWRVHPRGRATASARQVRFGLASLVEVWVEAGDICVRAKLCLTCIRLYFHHVNFGNSGFGSDCQRRKVRYFYREECPHSTPLTRNKLWRPSCCADAVQPDQVG